MNRRSLLLLCAGGVVGWTGATIVNDGDGDDGGILSPSNGGTDTPNGTPSETTVAPNSTQTPGSTPSPDATPETSPTPAPTATETPEPKTTTPDPSLRRNLDTYSRGFQDESSYKILYSLRNENDVTVRVTFEGTVTLRNGDALVKRKTATIDPGKGVNSEFVFEGYDSAPNGWGFQLRDVEAAGA